MAKVHIPAHWRHHTGGAAVVEVESHTIGELVGALARDYVDLGRELLVDGHVRPEIAIGINDTITENGVLEPVRDTDEVFLLPAIAGG